MCPAPTASSITGNHTTRRRGCSTRTNMRGRWRLLIACTDRSDGHGIIISSGLYKLGDWMGDLANFFVSMEWSIRDKFGSCIWGLPNLFLIFISSSNLLFSAFWLSSSLRPVVFFFFLPFYLHLHLQRTFITHELHEQIQAYLLSSISRLPRLPASSALIRTTQGAPDVCRKSHINSVVAMAPFSAFPMPVLLVPNESELRNLETTSAGNLPWSSSKVVAAAAWILIIRVA